MAEVVGTAWVRIRALTTGLAGEVSDAVDKVGPKLDPISKKVGDRVGGTMGKSMAEGIQTHLSEGGILIPDSVVKKSTDDFTSKFKSGVKEGLGDGTLGDGIDNNRLRRAFSSLGARLSSIFHRGVRDQNEKEKPKTRKSFEMTLPAIKLPLPLWAAILGVPGLVGAVKTITYYLGGLVAFIGTTVTAAIGGGAAIAAAFAQAAAGAGLLMLAFKVKTPELDAFQAGLKGIGEEWKSVVRATQRALFPQLTDALKTLTGSLLPVFKDLGAAVGDITGKTAKTVATILSSGPAIKMWEEFSASTKVMGTNLGRVAAALASALIPLMRTLNPLAQDFSDIIARTVERWSQLIQAGADSGKLQTFFYGAYLKAKQLMGALGDIVVGIWNIFKIGNLSLGFSAFDSFDQFAARFRAWTESISGQNKLREFFEQARPVMQEVNGLIGDIFRLFGEGISTGTGSENIVNFIRTLRTDVLPGLASIIRDLSSSLSGVDFQSFAKNLGDFLGAVARAEFLIPTLKVLTVMLNALAAVLNTPIVGSIAGQLLAMAVALGVVAGPIGSMVTGVTGLYKALKFLWVGNLAAGGSFGGLKAALSALGPVLGTFGHLVYINLIAPLGSAVAAAWPFIAIIAAIAAVIAGAYFLFQPIRDLIDGIWEKFQKLLDLFRDGKWGEALKTLASLMLDVLLFPFKFGAILAEEIAKKILQFVSNIPGWIASAASALWDWITGAAGQAGGKLGELWGAISSWFAELPGKIAGVVVGAASAVWDWLTTAVPMAAEKVGAFFAALPGAFAALASRVGSAVGGAASAVWDWLSNAISQAPGKIGYFIGYVLGLIVRLPIQIAQAIAPAAQSIVSWLIDAIPALLTNMASWAGSLWGAITGFISELPTRLLGAIEGITSWLTNAIPTLIGKWAEFQTNIWTAVANFIAELPGRIFGAIQAITQWLIDAIPTLLQNLANWISTVWGWVTGFISELPGRIAGAAGAVLSWIGTAASDFAGKILELANTIYRWAIGLPSDIVGWVGQTIGYIGEIGKSIIEGIWEGISGAAGWLWDKIKEFAGGIVSGFLDAITGGSPAKDLIPVGTSIVQGIALGIMNEGPTVNDAFKKIMAPYTSGKWAASLNVNPFGSMDLSTTNLLRGSVVSSTPNVSLKVMIGDRDITDIVDVRIETKNTELARQLVARSGG